MNLARGFHRITLVLAMIVGLLGGIISVLIIIGEHDYAQRSLRWKETDFINKHGYLPPPDGFVIDESKKEGERKKLTLEELAGVEEELEELKGLRNSFWVTISGPELVGLYMLVGLGGVVVGFFGAWIVIWLSGLAIYKLIRWIIIGFRDDM